MIGFIAIVAWTHMIDCDLSQKLVVVQNYYWEKSQTGIIIVGKIPERINLVGKISSTIIVIYRAPHIVGKHCSAPFLNRIFGF